MKWLWSGRLRPAKSRRPSVTSLVAGGSAQRGGSAAAFVGLAARIMAQVPVSAPGRTAVATAVASLVDTEAKALTVDDGKVVGDGAIEARLRLRAREEFTRGGAAGVQQWGNDVTALLSDIQRAIVIPNPSGHSIPVEVPLIGQVRDAPALIDAIVVRVLNWSSDDGRFRVGGLTARRVMQNLLNASNMTEEEARKRPQKLVWPKTAKGAAVELVERYLGNTPFATLLLSGVAWGIGERELHESVHVMGRSGAGKSQLLQYMVARLLQQPDPMGFIIIDSQGEMLEKIGRLKLFAPGQRLAGRLVWVDPRETERPIAVNVFAKNQARLSGYSSVMREQVENQVVDLLCFLFGGILGSDLTGKQSLSFNFLVRLLMTIPGASIATLLDVLKEPARFANEMAALGGRDREFFERQFFHKSNAGTRDQIERRLWEVMSHRTFDRMMSTPDNKLDLFDALNSGKVVLINTAKDFLGETRSAIMARLFLALALRAVFERAAIPMARRRPALLIVDEAHDVVDASVEKWIEQARKYRVGLCVAHQHLGQISTDLRKGLAGVGVKMIGGVSDHDARELAADLGVTPGFLLGLRREEKSATFALHVRNVTPSAVPLKVPLGYLEALPRMTEAEWASVREHSRQRYGATPRASPRPRATLPVTPIISAGSEDSGDDWRS